MQVVLKLITKMYVQAAIPKTHFNHYRFIIILALGVHQIVFYANLEHNNNIYLLIRILILIMLIKYFTLIFA